MSANHLLRNDSFKNSKDQNGGNALKTYKRRYLVCITFAFNSIANAMMWITFAPIQSKAAEHLNVSQSAINMYSMIFMISYVPGSMLCAFMFKRYYLRKSFIFSSFLQMVGAVVRYIGTWSMFVNNAWNVAHLSYILIFVGQAMCALCQPFYTNSPARIPAEWFSKEGRDVATAILSIVNPLGIGLGSFIPTFFVADDGEHMGGFCGITLLELILCVIGFVLTLLFFYDRPPTAPSISQKMKSNVTRSLRHEMGQLLQNTHFWFLVVGFGVGLGLFNALTTLINQYTAAFGYSTDNAGNFGAVLIGGGLIGAVIAGVAMELFRAYRSILKAFTCCAFVTLICLLWQLQPSNLTLVTVLFALFGFTAVPIIAITFEAAAECTYPANEELSSALLMTSGSMFGVVYIAVWGGHLPKTGDMYSNQMNFSTYFLAANAMLMLLCLFMFRGEYKRLQAEDKFTKYIEDLNDDDMSNLEHSHQQAISILYYANHEARNGEHTPVDIQSPHEQ